MTPKFSGTGFRTFAKSSFAEGHNADDALTARPAPSLTMTVTHSFFGSSSSSALPAAGPTKLIPLRRSFITRTTNASVNRDHFCCSFLNHNDVPQTQTAICSLAAPHQQPSPPLPIDRE